MRSDHIQSYLFVLQENENIQFPSMIINNFHTSLAQISHESHKAQSVK